MRKKKGNSGEDLERRAATLNYLHVFARLASLRRPKPCYLIRRTITKFQHASSRFCTRPVGQAWKTQLNLFNIHFHESRALDRVTQRFNGTIELNGRAVGKAWCLWTRCASWSPANDSVRPRELKFQWEIYARGNTWTYIQGGGEEKMENEEWRNETRNRARKECRKEKGSPPTS